MHSMKSQLNDKNRFITLRLALSVILVFNPLAGASLALAAHGGPAGA